MKKVIVFFLLLTHATFSQTTFQKIISTAPDDTWCSGIVQSTDGGFIIAGQKGNTNSTDCFLVKSDSLGNIIWSKTYGISTVDEMGYGSKPLQQTLDGGYIFTGRTNTSSDLLLIKTDNAGNINWTKTYGQSPLEYGISIVQTSDSGFLVVGVLDNGVHKLLLVKTNSNGDTTWAKTFIGGIFLEPASLLQTADGGFIIGGRTCCTIGAGLNDLFLVKLDSTGDPQWTKTYGGASNELGGVVQQTIDGGYIISGSTNSFGSGMTDLYLLKVNSFGDTLWTKCYGGPGDESLQSIIVCSDSGYILLGLTTSFGMGNTDVFLVKTNSNGDTLWTKVFGGTGEDRGSNLIETSDGGLIILGGSKSFGTGEWDMYMIKADANGNSGCNERESSPAISYTLTQVTNPGFLVSNESINSYSQSIVIDSGLTSTTLCISQNVDMVEDQIKILTYPNPTTGKFSINTNVKDLIDGIDVFNLTEEKIWSIRDNTEADITNLSSGIYIVKITSGEKTWRSKIIKQ